METRGLETQPEMWNFKVHNTAPVMVFGLPRNFSSGLSPLHLVLEYRLHSVSLLRPRPPLLRMTSALADTVLSPAAFFPRGVARVSPFTDPFLFQAEREPELPQPRALQS